jgi:hypothetical protein
LIAACSQNKSTVKGDSTDSTWQKDSIDVFNSVKKVYKWHDSAKNTLQDFSVIIVDSFQTGIDILAFQNTLKALKESHLFSNTFINNYKDLGELINTKLTTANPKYPNEINFAYQDADPWTFFQDDAGQYWDNFVISDFKLSSDKASFKWCIQEKYSTTVKYLVELVKENNKWVISYLDGFNKKSYQL